MSSYETLRYSLDNILKELDDICRSIDDLTDIEPNSSNNADNEYYQKIIKNPSIHLSSVGLASINKSLGLKKHSTPKSKTTDEIYYTVDDEDVYDRYNLSNFRHSKTFHQTNNFNETKNEQTFAPSNQKPKEENKSRNLLKPLTDRLFNSNRNPFRKHRLPSADSKDLNTVIGSVRDSFLFKKLSPLPLETTTKSTNDYYEANNYVESENLNEYADAFSEFDASRVRASPPPSKRNSKLVSSNSVNSNQVSFSMTNESFEYGDDEFSRKTPNRNINEDSDYLNPSEISKIECFYNSMGCYVYVSKCIAELYQIKREDEFDAIDNDPVNDYKIYMENLNNKTANNLSKTKVNYTYINSGVPVIVFNYGANPKRDKDLRILLVERSTGFCMWEFKFDLLTQFDLSNKMTLIRLTLNNNLAIFNNNFDNSQLNTLSNQTNTTTSSINYQNEYFEKFFNSKNRHAHKEHLLKFVIKRDCSEFSFVLSKIMTDKHNLDMFVIKREQTFIADDSGYFPPALPTTRCSSVTICHFNSMNTDSSHSSLADSNNVDHSAENNSLKPTIKSTLSKKASMFLTEMNKFETDLGVEFENDSNNADDERNLLNENDKADANQLRYRKLRKSDISSPLSFNHVSHLDKPVAIGKRYKFNYS